MKKYFAILSVSIFLAIPIFSFQAKACDSINLSTGDCLMDMGGGDLMNLNTGEMLWDLDKIDTKSMSAFGEN